ncbi:MAG: type II toxin-antitoxin system Phd/YefM family antitoxin [Bryobacteraceae bacterium]|nr:type II toxin-antitoxin system Phd/YefM family antitoxin [Bryobacteraceae bacterium]
MEVTRIGIREFRENLATYLESRTPVAITRHGTTIGVYVPTQPKPSQADLEALRVAGEKMRELIAAAGTGEEDLVTDFKRLRRERRARKN